jgi:hypothetical protein
MVVAVAVWSVAGGVGVVFNAPQAASAETISKSLRSAVAGLPFAAEERAGYSRTLFKLWIDADHDGCNTRHEVLLDEALTKPHRGSRCSLTGGRWFSYYDGKYTTNSSALDIDHLVPLAEAWDSGARSWTAAQRQAYANDLDDTRTLVAVTASVNRSKGDRDPAEWLPPRASARCQYVRSWVAVKLRWRLTVDAVEKDSLAAIALHCSNATINAVVAPILG